MTECEPEPFPRIIQGHDPPPVLSGEDIAISLDRILHAASIDDNSYRPRQPWNRIVACRVVRQIAKPGIQILQIGDPLVSKTFQGITFDKRFGSIVARLNQVVPSPYEPIAE